VIDHVLVLRAGEEVIIGTNAVGVDTSVEVLPEDESSVLASDDNGGGGDYGDALLIFRAPETASYLVRIRAIALGSGSFPITIRLGRFRTESVPDSP
jgi:hypothetical protein